jgi:replicative DNA helicase
MREMSERGEPIDRVTLANELDRYGELETIGGLTYLVSLDDGLPRLPNIDSYVKIIVEKFLLRRAVAIADKITKQAVSQEFTPDEISRNAQAMLSENIPGCKKSDIETVGSFIQNYPAGVEAYLDPSKRPPGIPTGFSKLDEWMGGGLREAEIIIIGARPSVGKSSLSLSVAMNMLAAGVPGAFFSLEMSKQALTDRMVCAQSNMSLIRFLKGNFNADETKRVSAAARYVDSLPLYIDDTAGLTPPDVRTKLMRVMQESPIEWAVIDYGQIMRPRQNKRFSNENAEYNSICDELQEIFKTLKKRLILLSQLTRRSENDKGGDKRPKLSDCLGSGAWERICNVGCLLYREGKEKPDRSDLRDVATLIVQKNRSGPEGDIALRFTPWLMKFEDRAEAAGKGE